MTVVPYLTNRLLISVFVPEMRAAVKMTVFSRSDIIIEKNFLLSLNASFLKSESLNYFIDRSCLVLNDWPQAVHMPLVL